jgi:hypothetical protein
MRSSMSKKTKTIGPTHSLTPLIPRRLKIPFWLGHNVALVPVPGHEVRKTMTPSRPTEILGKCGFALIERAIQMSWKF